MFVAAVESLIRLESHYGISLPMFLFGRFFSCVPQYVVSFSLMKWHIYWRSESFIIFCSETAHHKRSRHWHDKTIRILIRIQSYWNCNDDGYLFSSFFLQFFFNTIILCSVHLASYILILQIPPTFSIPSCVLFFFFFDSSHNSRHEMGRVTVNTLQCTMHT